MTSLTPKTYIPLGVAVAAVLLFGGLLWRTATWTTQTDSRLANIEQKLIAIDEKLSAKVVTMVMPKAETSKP
jgi:HAMP domain-containing protein